MPDAVRDDRGGFRPASETVHSASFPETRWSNVRRALASDSVGSIAIAELCRLYWRPVYAYVRSKGNSVDDALDLTQGFFTRLVEMRDFRGADPARGRFRAYVLAAMKHYLSDARRREHAVKRGQGRQMIIIDVDEETLSRIEPVDRNTPERAYVRRWALDLLERTSLRLRERFAADGRLVQFESLRATLTPGESLDARAAAAALGWTVNAVHVAAHRLRAAYGELIREEVAATVDDPADVEDELNALLGAFRP